MKDCLCVLKEWIWRGQDRQGRWYVVYRFIGFSEDGIHSVEGSAKWIRK